MTAFLVVDVAANITLLTIFTMTASNAVFMAAFGATIHACAHVGATLTLCKHIESHTLHQMASFRTDLPTETGSISIVYYSFLALLVFFSWGWEV